MDTIDARAAQRGRVSDVAQSTGPVGRVESAGGLRATPRTRRHGCDLPGPTERRVLLVIDDGPDAIVLPLDEGHTHIGRSWNADVELDDASVSRRHAVIVRDGDTVRILDDCSRNGVHVNGDRVMDVELRDGDTIRLGRVELTFVQQ